MKQIPVAILYYIISLLSPLKQIIHVFICDYILVFVFRHCHRLNIRLVKMYYTAVNTFTLYVIVFMTVNISLLSPFIEDDETQYNAIRNLLIFTAWALTMRYMVNPERVPWVIILYSSCILALLMFHTLSNWAYLYSVFPQQGDGGNILTDQQVNYLKIFIIWFDTLAFFYIIYLLERRPVPVRAM